MSKLKDLAHLQATHDIGASFLKGFVRKLQAAIPPTWLSFPDAMPEPPSLTISCLFKPPISISSRGMYRSIADAFDVQPIGIGQWRSTLGFAAWTSAWKSIAAARLGTPYSRDMAFKFLHRVLPTPHRLTLFDRFQDPSCPLCHHIRADLEHVFRRCPAARALRVPLRRILFSVLSYVPPTITLLSAPFLPSLSSSAAASFIVWTFVVVFWQHRLNLSLHSIIGIIAATIRRRILADWHLARRHQPTNVNFFCSQWMPPCRHSSLCLINPDETLSVRICDSHLCECVCLSLLLLVVCAITYAVIVTYRIFSRDGILLYCIVSIIVLTVSKNSINI